MNNLAIIPARGGSKRIPRKNIKCFLGKPIIAYSIEAALQSGLFEEVIVSTDDQEIAETAKDFGAKVPFFRSTETSSDYATTLAVLWEVVSEYKRLYNKKFDLVCCIYPTAPLIQVQHLKKGYDLLCGEKFFSVIPITAFCYPVWRGLKIDKNNRIQMVWPEYKNSRSQDLEKVYHDAGQWYWINMTYLTDSLYTKNTGTIILSEEEVQDIDNLSDWTLAEIKYTLIKNKNE